VQRSKQLCPACCASSRLKDARAQRSCIGSSPAASRSCLDRQTPCTVVLGYHKLYARTCLHKGLLTDSRLAATPCGCTPACQRRCLGKHSPCTCHAALLCIAMLTLGPGQTSCLAVVVCLAGTTSGLHTSLLKELP